MQEALLEARAAAAIGEVPIGCVVVHEPTGRVIARAGNRRQAGQAIGHWRLIDCALVVTLEPCPMCAGAIVNARVPRLIYGCTDPKAGAVRTLYQICQDSRLNHQVDVCSGVLADECAELLRTFFQVQRSLGKK